MRRALNILQACHAAYDRVDEVAVYNCTGNPYPADIEAIVKSMMNEEFATAYEHCNTLKQQKGMALADMVSFVTCKASFSYESVRGKEILQH